MADAANAINGGRRQICLNKHLDADLEELELDTEDDLWALIPDLLREIQACGPQNCYAGRFPPTRSYEKVIEQEELWPFRWTSRILGKEMYLKFVLRRNNQGNWDYLHVDLHPSRPK